MSAFKAQAIQALDGMAAIVRNEMLMTGAYLSPVVVNHDLAEQGAICGGHQACAIGSLWLGAGIKPQQYRYGPGDSFLPGVNLGNREGFLRDHPGLSLAYDALNEAARVYADAHGLTLSLETVLDEDGEPGDWTCEVEALFEGYYSDVSEHPTDDAYGQFVNRDDLLLVIEDAKRRIA